MAEKIIKIYDSIPEEWTQIELFHTTAKLLPQLTKPTIIKHKGSDLAADFNLVACPNQVRGSLWISTLQHGNESTGLHVFADLWKKMFTENIVLPYDIYFFVANGHAALTGDKPWSARFAQYQEDNNRCWFRDSEKELADKINISALQRQQVKEISDYIEQSTPTYLLDVHDTTGYNKALGFTLRDIEHEQNKILYSMTDHVIFLERLTGSFLDKFSEKYESFAVECGKSGTAEAFDNGKSMIKSFINLQKTKQQPKNAYEKLKRIVIRQDVDFYFHNFNEKTIPKDSVLRLRHDIESLNQNRAFDFGMLGMYFGDGMPLTVYEKGKDVTDNYLRKDTDGKIYVAAEHLYGQLFSTNKQNVRDSELGYVSEKMLKK